MSRLPITIEPFQTEALRHYLLRLCEANYYSQPSWILRLLNNEVTDTDIPAWMRLEARLSTVIRPTAIPLSNITYQGGEDTLPLSFGGIEIPRSMLQLNRHSICPLCVKEFGHVLAIWDIKVFRVCPRHDIAMLDHCMECERPLNWRRQGLLTCSCGADLGRQRPPKNQPGPFKSIAKIVTHFFPTPYQSRRRALSGHWSKIPRNDFWKTVQLLTSTVNSKSNWRQNYSDSDLTEVMALVGPVLSDWPKGFEVYLENLIGRDIGRGNEYSLRDTASFANFYKSVHSGIASEPFDRLQQGFRLLYDGKLSRTFPPSKKSAAGLMLQKTLTQSQKALMTFDTTLEKLVKLRALPGRTATISGHKRIWFSPSELEFYRANNFVTVEAKLLASVLGTPRSLTRSLFGKPADDTHLPITFPIQTFDRLLRRLNVVKWPIYVDDDWYINLRALSHIAKKLGISDKLLARAIWRGVLTPRRAPSPQLARKHALYCFWDVLLMGYPKASASGALIHHILGQPGDLTLAQRQPNWANKGLCVSHQSNTPIRDILNFSARFAPAALIQSNKSSRAKFRDKITNLSDDELISSPARNRVYFIAADRFRTELAMVNHRLSSRGISRLMEVMDSYNIDLGPPAVHDDSAL